MDERFRGVTLVNTLNTNPLNPLSPHMSGWVELIGLRQPDLVALQATKVPEQGRLVREQMAQALRVTEEAEQT